MLVITRQEGQEILIGKDGGITVRIEAIRGDRVRVSVDAPPEVPVHRKEVFESMLQESGEVCSLAGPGNAPPSAA